MITRREAIASLTSTTLGLRAWTLEAQTLIAEQQKGDPEDAYETVHYDPRSIEALTQLSGRAVFETWDKSLPGSLLASARSVAMRGVSRTSDSGQVDEYLKLFGMGIKSSSGTYVPYCAAGIGYVAIEAFARSHKKDLSGNGRLAVMRSLAADIEHYYFYPTVSCIDMWNAAKAKRRWVTKASQQEGTVKPGWIVLFDWSRRGTPDHCGIVRTATVKSLFTVEFNTTTKAGAGSQRNGGAVAERERPYDRVLGYIRTDTAPPKM